MCAGNSTRSTGPGYAGSLLDRRGSPRRLRSASRTEDAITSASRRSTKAALNWYYNGDSAIWIRARESGAAIATGTLLPSSAVTTLTDVVSRRADDGVDRSPPYPTRSTFWVRQAAPPASLHSELLNNYLVRSEFNKQHSSRSRLG